MCPATDTISTYEVTTSGWSNFTTGSGVIRSAKVMANFGTFRGHLMPFDPTLTAFAANSYDLGSVTYPWRRLYGSAMGRVSALVDGANIATDASLGDIFKVTLGGNRTMDAPTNPVAGQKIIYRITQDGTGTRTITWNAIFRFGTDVTSPTLTTTINKTDYIGFIYNSDATKWDCVAVAKGY